MEAAKRRRVQPNNQPASKMHRIWRNIFGLAVTLGASLSVLVPLPSAGAESGENDSTGRGHVSWEQIRDKWASVPIDEVKAPARQGDLQAQHYLGRYYSEGLGGKVDFVEGVRWYRQSAEKGFASSQNNLGLAYLYGKGVAMDLGQSLRWLEAAAAQGMTNAMVIALAKAHQAGSPEKWSEYREMLEKAARGGDVEAMVLLGRLLSNTRGVVHEPANARYWFVKARDAGRDGLCSNIGWACFDAGDSVTAYRWFRLGVLEKDPYCELSIGWMMVEGRRDVEDGIGWIRKAAEKGLPAAQRNLGRIYEQAEFDPRTGKPPSYRDAEKWYRLADKQGDAEAANRLALMALAGRFRPNGGELEVWIKKASDAGYLKAKQAFEQRNGK